MKKGETTKAWGVGGTPARIPWRDGRRAVPYFGLNKSALTAQRPPDFTLETPVLLGSFLRCLPIIITCVLFSSCASKGPAFRSQPDYSTAYLGPNGEILFATPRAPKRPAEAVPVPDRNWTWSDEGVQGPPSIVIDLSEQKARFYKGNVEVGTAAVSTGREGYDTPAGNFSVIQKNRNHVSNLYGNYVDANGEVVVKNVGVNKDPRPPGTRFQGAPMPCFLRVTGAVGMHAGYLPGYAASHGCIRLPHGAAEKFFENAPTGTPVSIVR
jgi:hypothetical protein